MVEAVFAFSIASTSDWVGVHVTLVAIPVKVFIKVEPTYTCIVCVKLPEALFTVIVVTSPFTKLALELIELARGIVGKDQEPLPVEL